MWGNYYSFIDEVDPVDEEVGVKIGFHSDEPPQPELAGLPRCIFGSHDGYQRALDIADSPNRGLELCVGSWSEMSPEEWLTGLRYFGERGKILYVHFRDVLGTVPAFREAFIGEGNLNMFQVMKTLKELNFKGFLIDDQVPRMVGDTGWVSLSRAFANGQMVTMLEFLNQN